MYLRRSRETISVTAPFESNFFRELEWLVFAEEHGALVVADFGNLAQIGVVDMSDTISTRLFRLIQVLVHRVDKINEIKNTGFHVNAGTHAGG